MTIRSVTQSSPVIAVCIPLLRRGGLHPLTFRSLLGLRFPEGAEHFYSTTIDLPVADARNEITRLALDNPKVTHLLYVDSDIVFEGDALLQLLEHDLHVVGGLCHGRRDPYPPMLMYKQEGNESSNGYAFRYDYPANQIVSVDATGCAFLLVKREVFLYTKPLAWARWFEERQGYSEDVSFCQRVKESGLSINVDTETEIGHVAEITVIDGFARKNRTALLNPYKP